jgi:hypothetical protein
MFGSLIIIFGAPRELEVIYPFEGINELTEGPVDPFKFLGFIIFDLEFRCSFTRLVLRPGPPCIWLVDDYCF